MTNLKLFGLVFFLYWLSLRESRGALLSQERFFGSIFNLEFCVKLENLDRLENRSGGGFWA
ncbi:hypothetical protein predicted by Glimmer/Critica [Bdellovibrio bacteriovorus HD100]|uniref:Uncharacterized protein n=1 Tax=Bdellovibrio bacteriovorus (strain ATCC 15356 / DSM 50701 / NCIMB 9529 / HD100) TaxID=264462 RepID=Q6MGW8_BDEBA|nr:hypothetical protein predicted by Glimmer/Critica [Bdellovibrio bacteriovorus HD100]